jgi:hypothetical protein
VRGANVRGSNGFRATGAEPKCYRFAAEIVSSCDSTFVLLNWRFKSLTGPLHFIGRSAKTDRVISTRPLPAEEEHGLSQ